MAFESYQVSADPIHFKIQQNPSILFEILTMLRSRREYNFTKSSSHHSHGAIPMTRRANSAKDACFSLVPARRTVRTISGP
jgi:hypothetical protein